jgi:uncharacterized protein (DUF2141 family)
MTIRRRVSVVLAVTSALALGACASGPTYSEMQTSIPSLAADKGRILIYRTTVAGFAIQPDVRVNGEVVGSAAPQGFFYVDRPAGSYTIAATTEVERSLSLTLAAGQTRYVRLAISIGLLAGHVSPELVDDAEGAKDISTLHYAGK